MIGVGGLHVPEHLIQHTHHGSRNAAQWNTILTSLEELVVQVEVILGVEASEYEALYCSHDHSRDHDEIDLSIGVKDWHIVLTRAARATDVDDVTHPEDD